MEYIRVKDGCYEWINTFAKYDEARNKATELGLTYSAKIIKRSDSLEELSDYFFHLTYNVDTDNYEINYWGRAKELNKYLKDYKEELEFGIGIGEDKVFLAILTDKGLVFVAKMNKKGGLVVL